MKWKKQLEKRREKKWKKFTGRPDYGYYTPKTESLKEKILKSRSPKQVTVNDTQLHRNVTVRKKKKRSYAEIVKLNNSERTEENKESLDTGYKKNGKVTSLGQEEVSLEKMCNGNKEEYCDIRKEATPDLTFYKGNEKAKNTLNQNLTIVMKNL